MSTLAKQPGPTQQRSSTKVALTDKPFDESSRAASPIPSLRCRSPTQVLPRGPQARHEQSSAGPASPRSPPFEHDFGRISVYPPTRKPIESPETLEASADPHEQEPAPLAEHVMRMPDLRLQRKCACGGTPGLKGEDADLRRIRLNRLSRPSVQAKLIVNQRDDRYEREADRVADMVMRVPEPHLQRQLEPSIGAPQEIQRKCSACEDDEALLRKASSTPGGTISSTVETGISSLRTTGGVPLDRRTRAFMEPRFGADFSNVRVHANARASSVAQSLKAHAFTVGRDVFFAENSFDPSSIPGRWLLAHELTHTIQQSSGPRPREAIGSRRIGRGPSVNGWVNHDIIQRAGPKKEDDESDSKSEAGGTVIEVPSRVPKNAIGIQWTAGKHLSVFANVDGKTTMMGYRAKFFQHLAGTWSLEKKTELNAGVPGKWRNDAGYKNLPSYIIYREVDAQTAKEYASEIRARKVGGTYRYSPPRVDHPAHEKLAERIGSEQALKCSGNNCLTVTRADIKKSMGFEMEVLVKAPEGGKAGGSGVTVNISTGNYQTAEGEGFSRRDKGSAARARQFFEEVPDTKLEQHGAGKSSPAQGTVNLTLRGASLLLTGLAIKSTYDNLAEAHKKGEKEYTAAVLEETAAWEGGILGSAIGAAVAGGAVCLWTGPGTIVCALAGFAGGLAGGSAGAALSSKAVRETLAGADRLIQSIGQGAQAAADVLSTAEEAGRRAVTSLEGTLWFHEMIETNAKLAPSLWDIDEALMSESTTNALVELFSDLDIQLLHALDENGDVNDYLKLAHSPVEGMGVTKAELEAVIALVHADEANTFPYSPSEALKLDVSKLHDAFWEAILGLHVVDPEILADTVIRQAEDGERELPTSSLELTRTLGVTPRW